MPATQRCPRCQTAHGLHVSSAVLNRGSLDTDWTCWACGYVDYGEVQIARAMRDASTLGPTQQHRAHEGRHQRKSA